MATTNRLPEDRIAVLDGAMGTMIQSYGLQEEDFHLEAFPDTGVELKGDNECLNLTHPELIESIHREYIEAYADIITTNSFSANRISQREYGLEQYAPAMALAAAKIARRVADETPDRRVLVAGSVGPTSKSLTLSPDISRPEWREYDFDDMVKAYREQIDALIEGGVDLIILETTFDALNTKAAIYVMERWHRGFPLIVSATISDRSGRTLTGQTLQAYYTSVRHYPLTAFGINCSLGARDMVPLVREISSFSEFPLICYPNAGLPNELGHYDEAPDHMAHYVYKMASSGLLNIVGGCCGTDPAHICATSTAVSDLAPRVPKAPDEVLCVSGLEAYRLDTHSNHFTNIGERTNVSGSRKFARLIATGDYEAALQVAADQIDNGANIIDINMDDAMLDSAREMSTFIRFIENDPTVSRAALMIDSSHWETILAGLKNAQGRCIVNSISLKEGEGVFLERALEIHDLGAAMVVMAFDEQGQATSYERKISICKRAYDLLTAHGIPPQDIIFDVNVLSIGTGLEEHATYAVDFIEAVRWIKTNLPGAYTSGGISNLSFAFRGNNVVREAMHSAFLYHAIAAGLDMGIVNPGMLQVYDEIEPELLRCVEDVIFNRDPGATERLIAKAQEIQTTIGTTQTVASEVPAASPTERVGEALVKGRGEHIERDVLECLQELGTPVQVIEGPLMAGMERVGELFSQGKMFLPQVVKSAKIMKDAVSALEPYMTSSDGEHSSDLPVIITATVKGDVHDIGKNITDIVLTCNGFRVIDLGVMVSKETILAAALEHGASIIGVSGLITPSLYQMEELCREMSAREMDIPLFVGGATTSALHTAIKLMPLYEHVFYSHDASSAAVMAGKCMMDRRSFENEQHLMMERTAAMHRANHPADGQQKKSTYSLKSYLKYDECSFRDVDCEELDMRSIMSSMDWDMFLMCWGVKPTSGNEEIPKLLKEGRALLRRLNRRGQVHVRYSMRFFKASSHSNCLMLFDQAAPGGRYLLPMLRQENGGRLSLCDYAPDLGSGLTGPIGVFAICVEFDSSPEDEYQRMLEHCVRVSVAETASKWIDRQVKGMLPAGSRRICKPAIGYSCCPDHSLKRDVLQMLSPDLGITLTDSCAMIPDASICGFIIPHPSATYPEIQYIGQAQFEAYSAARGFTEEEAQKYLGYMICGL